MTEKEYKEIEFNDIIKLFKKEKLLFISSSVFIFIIAIIIFLFFITPKYEVNTLVKVDEEDEKNFMMDNPAAFLLGDKISDNSVLNMEIFKTRLLRNKLTEEFNLGFAVKEHNKNMFFYIINVLSGNENNYGCFLLKSVPEKMKNGKTTIEIIEKGYKISFGSQSSECNWDEKCSFLGEDVILNRYGPPIPEGTNFSVTYRTNIKAREFIENNLEISEIEDASNLLSISFSNSNSFKAKIIIDSLVEKFTEKKNSLNKKHAEFKELYINKILDNLKNEIYEKSNRLIEFQKENESYAPAMEFQAMMEKKEELKNKIDMLRLQMQHVKVAGKLLKKNPMSPVTVSLSEENITLQEALLTHNKKANEVEKLSQNLTDNHPDLLSAKSELQESGKIVHSLLEHKRKSLGQSISIVRNLVKTIKREQRNIPENLLTFETFKRDIELSQKAYISLASQLYSTLLNKIKPTPYVEILDPPSSDIPKAFPSTIIFLAASIILSLAGGFLTIMSKAFLKYTIEYKEEISNFISFPVISSFYSDNKEYDSEIISEIIRSRKKKNKIFATLSLCEKNYVKSSELSSNLREKGENAAIVFFSSETGISPTNLLFVEKGKDDKIFEIRLRNENITNFIITDVFDAFLNKLREKYSYIIIDLGRTILNSQTALFFSKKNVFTLVEVRKNKTSFSEMKSLEPLDKNNEGIVVFVDRKESKNYFPFNLFRNS